MWHNKHPRLQRHVCFPLDSQTVLCFLQFWWLCYVCFDLAVYFLFLGMPTTYLSYLSCCNFVYTLSSERTPIDIQLIQYPIDNLIVIEPILSHDTFSILFSLGLYRKIRNDPRLSLISVFSPFYERKLVVSPMSVESSLVVCRQRQAQMNYKEKYKDNEMTTTRIKTKTGRKPAVNWMSVESFSLMDPRAKYAAVIWIVHRWSLINPMGKRRGGILTFFWS